MTRVYISIGSNVDPDRHVRLALRDLECVFGPMVVSPVYRSKAVGFAGDDFYNLVVGLDTDLPPQDLADTLRGIETDHGRLRGGEKFSPRTLDLDPLTYGDACIREGRLVLPRDEILRYAFVLRPLADIAPDVCHPELGMTFAELWAGFDASAESMEPVQLDSEPEGGAGV